MYMSRQRRVWTVRVRALGSPRRGRVGGTQTPNSWTPLDLESFEDLEENKKTLTTSLLPTTQLHATPHPPHPGMAATSTDLALVLRAWGGSDFMAHM